MWNDFQHSIFDTLPRLAIVCPFLRQHRRVRLVVGSQAQAQLVQLACPLPSKRVQVLETAMAAPEIFVPHFESTGEPLKMGITPPRAMKPLGSHTQRGSKVVYLAREKSRRRAVANEKELLEAMRNAFGRLLLELHPGDFHEDRKLLADAAVVVGPHGGALANMVFAPVNTSVVEFIPLTRIKQAVVPAPPHARHSACRRFPLASGLTCRRRAATSGPATLGWRTRWASLTRPWSPPSSTSTTVTYPTAPRPAGSVVTIVAAAADAAEPLGLLVVARLHSGVALLTL